jgi:imidazoleglycerol-phosphate dehydratase
MSNITRKTKETNITIKSNIYGNGIYKIDTGIGFLDHMLESFSKHSGIDLEISCTGDVHIDDHHSVEDVAITLGTALHEDIFPINSIARFGIFAVPMDETLIESHIDLSNRPFLYYNLDIDGKVGNFDVELVEEFFRALVNNLKITLHLEKRRGKNRHHIIESSFKAFAISLKNALIKTKNGIPSTKGII